MKEFLTYFKALMYTPSVMQTKNGYAFMILKIYLIVFVTFMIGMFSTNLFPFVAMIMLLVATIGIGSYYQERPSVVSVLPIGYKKRTLYYFLSCIYLTLIIVAVCIAVVVVMMAIMLPITLLSSPATSAPEPEPGATEETVAYVITAATVLFQIFSGLYHFSCFSVIMRIKRKSAFFLSFAAYSAVNLVGGLALGTAIALGKAEVEWNPLSSFLYFSNLTQPWLAVALCAVISIAAFVGAVMFVLRQEKPKQF